mmetsp:Transcript_99533/g.182560  ORF Transcript_99533/g.182560 Transcript_99533/m.182560 type:complete len:224 (+) Transcript_99533:124-795(+)
MTYSARRAKIFYSPDGVEYRNLLEAAQAAKACTATESSSSHDAAGSSGMSGEHEQKVLLTRTGTVRQRGTQILLGRQARKLKKSEQEGEADAEASTRANKKSRQSVEADPAQGSKSTTTTTDACPEQQQSDGYTIQMISEGSEWSIEPDDVLWIDLPIIGRNIEAAGWTLKEASCPDLRVFQNSLGDSSLKLFSCGKLIVSSCPEQAAYDIATAFVSDWLVNA